MRDRGCQLSRRGDAVHVAQFAQQRLVAGFHAAPAAVLVEQPEDQGGLQQHREHDDNHAPPVLLPHRRFAKPQFAARRQAAFAHAPLLQLPPVEHRTDYVRHADRNGCSAFAAENPGGEPAGLLADQRRVEHKSSGGAPAHMGLDVDHDRPVGGPGDFHESVSGREHPPVAVDIEGGVDDCRILGQARQARRELSHRQAGQVQDLHLRPDGGQFLGKRKAECLAFEPVADQRHKRTGDHL